MAGRKQSCERCPEGGARNHNIQCPKSHLCNLPRHTQKHAFLILWLFLRLIKLPQLRLIITVTYRNHYNLCPIQIVLLCYLGNSDKKNVCKCTVQTQFFPEYNPQMQNLCMLIKDSKYSLNTSCSYPKLLKIFPKILF